MPGYTLDHIWRLMTRGTVGDFNASIYTLDHIWRLMTRGTVGGFNDSMYIRLYMEINDKRHSRGLQYQHVHVLV